MNKVLKIDLLLVEDQNANERIIVKNIEINDDVSKATLMKISKFEWF